MYGMTLLDGRVRCILSGSFKILRLDKLWENLLWSGEREWTHKGVYLNDVFTNLRMRVKGINIGIPNHCLSRTCRDYTSFVELVGT